MFMEIDKFWRGGRNYLKWVAIFAKIGDNLPSTLRSLIADLEKVYHGDMQIVPDKFFTINFLENSKSIISLSKYQHQKLNN